MDFVFAFEEEKVFDLDFEFVFGYISLSLGDYFIQLNLLIMNTEKRNSLFVVSYFALGLFGGWLIGSIKPVPGIVPQQHIKTEYYLELKGDGSAVIEDCGGNTYTCPRIEDIPNVLIKDNL